MALKTFVKVGNITNLSDARYCAGMGVDELGFCVDRDHESYANPAMVSSIQEWVSGVEFVLEGNPHPDDAYTFNQIQVTPDILTPEMGDQYILSCELDWIRNYYGNLGSLHYILLQGTDEVIPEGEMNKISELCQELPIVLGYGFDAGNILSILESLKIKGIAMKGTQESRPGFKDYDQLADILELLEVDDWS